jgi:hypothetical protein
MVKRPSRIPRWRTINGEVLSGNPFSSVVLSSTCANWRNFAFDVFRRPTVDEHGSGDVLYVTLDPVSTALAVHLAR